MTSVLIIDDQPVFRRQLKNLLLFAGMTVVGEARDLISGEQIARNKKPDIAVVDVMLPGESGLVGAKRLKDAAKGIRIFLVSAHHDSADLFSQLAEETGAEAFIPKDALDLEFVCKWMEKKKP
ncbi:MAG: response regulator transcription factor [Leptolinea sp.]|nr:response regulator transcription factor [Leptolinea sp.]